MLNDRLNEHIDTMIIYNTCDNIKAERLANLGNRVVACINRRLTDCF